VNSAYQSAGGSLYAMSHGGGGAGGAGGGGPGTNASTSLYAVAPREPRKLKKYDLITVIVREESDSKTKSLTDLKKSAEINAILEQYIQFNLSNFAVKGQPPLTNQPQIKGSADRNFKGDGSTDRSDSFSARVQAQVIDVKPNGILIIQATKQIKNDDEEQKFTLTGMVRAEDVTPDNSVLSTQLADLNLEKMTKGAVSDTSKRGWLPRLMDALNPF
jgi:flagellar L-ring protein precursor FlgH